ncbi:MAG: hypothetical protein ACOYZ6_04190 [Chloroflexota bacterium]
MRRFMPFLFDAVTYVLLILVSTQVGVKVGFELGVRVYALVRNDTLTMYSTFYVIITLLLGAGLTVWAFKRMFPSALVEFTPEVILSRKWSFLWRNLVLWALVGYTFSGLTLHWIIPMLMR